MLIKFAFALLTMVSISATAADRAGLSVVASDTPRSARITGPKNLTDLGKGQYGKWVIFDYPVRTVRKNTEGIGIESLELLR